MSSSSQNRKPVSTPYPIEELLAWPRQNLKGLDTVRLNATSPVVLANFLERLEVDDRRTVLRRLREESASNILSEMDADDSAAVVGAMREERALKILEEFAPDDAADIVAELHEKDRTRLLQKLEPETAQTVKNLLTYEPETAGGIMTPEVATVSPATSVNEAINRVRALSEEMEDIYYVYVVDGEGRLQGVVSMRDLILARENQKISEVMNRQIKGVCHPEMDREAVALAIAEFNLLSLPVVDTNGKLLGMVTVDDVIDILQDEATEDIQRLVGAGPDESIHDNLSFSVKRRHPWLQVNLITAFLAAGVVFLFQKQIEKLTLLAVFMPVIASLGGNAGNQTLAVAIRSMALGEVEDIDSKRLCLQEAAKGIINGVAVGLIASFVSYLITQNMMMSLVVLTAMVLNMGLAGLTGAFIPLLLKKMNFDPAQSSSIFLTAVTDVAGFFIFLTLGSWVLL